MVTSRNTGPGEQDAPKETAYPYPPDEFDVDEWDGPAGAHRAARKGWVVALPWLVGALVVLMLTGIILNLTGNDDEQTTVAGPSVTPTAAATAERTSAPNTNTAPATGTATASATASQSPTASESPTVNRKTRAQILNATRRNGLAHRLQRNLNASGWNIVSVDTYRRSKPPTTVYYRNSEDKATAQELADKYGARIKQSQDWRVPITLMIGDDFNGG